ncbi:hypothetical protein, partial [Luedemannella flava]|uniref:hypothetical protein n=1 Tax=Luedemannella flava TaxID=349316 RepID=UPI0031D5D33F
MASLRAFASLARASRLRLAAGRLRTAAGIIVLLTAVPLTIGGIAGWHVMQHRGPGGGFDATLAPLDTDGYAIVVPDPSALFAAQGYLARTGASRVRVTAASVGGEPLLLGLATDPAGYLAGVRHGVLGDVRMARGPLPVRVDTVAGTRTPADPRAQTFWRGTAPAAVDLTMGGSSPPAPALVLMRADGAPGIHATVRVSVFPRWLNPATWGLLTAGPLLLVFGVLMLSWRRRTATVVVVPTTDVDELVTVLRQATGQLPTVPAARHRHDSARRDPARAPAGRPAP